MKPKYPDPSQVWQRVLPREPQDQQSLQLLIRQLELDIAFLKQRSKAGDDPTVGLLMREYTGQLHSLRGILLLTGGSFPRQGGNTGDNSLARCFDNALRRLGAYQLRSSDPVYGPVFRDLAQQTQQHCRYISQLLGSSLQNAKEKGR